MVIKSNARVVSHSGIRPLIKLGPPSTTSSASRKIVRVYGTLNAIPARRTSADIKSEMYRMSKPTKKRRRDHTRICALTKFAVWHE